MSTHFFKKPNYTIFHSIPWNTDKNIGVSYNQTMNLIGTNDWVCFLDGDAVHTSHFFGKRIEEVVEYNPQYSLFTCYTNRVGFTPQIAPGVNQITNDQKYHREFGKDLWAKYGHSVIDITNKHYISGVLLLIKKSVWEKVGGFNESGMLTIDNDIHMKVKNLGGKVGLMKGIYVQHWYRGGDKDSKSHLL